jgi:hypothetical protein
MLPDSSPKASPDLFSTFERLFKSVLLPNRDTSMRKEDDLLLVESIVRSHLTHLRLIYSSPPIHSTFPSIIDLFLYIECHLLQTLENDLCIRMEHFLEVFDGIESFSSNTESFVRSILYDSNFGRYPPGRIRSPFVSPFALLLVHSFFLCIHPTCISLSRLCVVLLYPSMYSYYLCAISLYPSIVSTNDKITANGFFDLKYRKYYQKKFSWICIDSI